MSLKRTTPVPNIMLDQMLPHLTMAELKVVLVIIRQTNGWALSNGQRKNRDWISQSQFVLKTGLTRQTISSTLQTLSNLKLISITDFKGNATNTPSERKGKSKLFYALGRTEDLKQFNMTCKVSRRKGVRLLVQDKTNPTKENITKSLQSIKDILKRLYT